MWRLLVGLLVGMALSASVVEALRLPSPPTFTEWNESTATQLNVYLRSIWQLTNGRYTAEVTTTNPDGTRVGTNGDEVYYNNGGTYKACVNTTATTAASPTGTTWRCSSAYTAP